MAKSISLFLYNIPVFTVHKCVTQWMNRNYAAVNIHVHIFTWAYIFSLLWYIYLEMELLNHMATLCLTIWRTDSFSQCTVLYSKWQYMRVPVSPRPCQHLPCFSLQPSWWVWNDILMWLWFAFPWWLMMLNNFYGLVGHLCIFGEKCIQILCIFLNWVVFYCWDVAVLYIV